MLCRNHSHNQLKKLPSQKNKIRLWQGLFLTNSYWLLLIVFKVFKLSLRDLQIDFFMNCPRIFPALMSGWLICNLLNLFFSFFWIYGKASIFYIILYYNLKCYVNDEMWIIIIMFWEISPLCTCVQCHDASTKWAEFVSQILKHHSSFHTTYLLSRISQWWYTRVSANFYDAIHQHWVI